MTEKEEQLALQDPGYDDFVKHQATMNAIVREMKEIPELPSEIPTDVNPLTKVEFLDNGGVLTYMEGHDYPYRGFPFFEFVDKIDVIKKISKNIQSGVFHALKNKSKLFLYPLILLSPLTRRLIWSFAYTFSTLIARFKIKTNKFSEAVREIHRACSVEQKGEKQQIKELREMIRDVECMVLEFDNAYRYRIQDVGVEINKTELKKNPIQEIVRVIDLMSSRELLQEQKDKWTLLKLFTKWYMRFDRPFLNMIASILNEIDPDKIKLTIEDKNYCARRKDYIFGFMSDPQLPEDHMIMEVVALDRQKEDRKKEMAKRHEIEMDMLQVKHKNDMEKLGHQFTPDKLQTVQEQFNAEYKKVIENFNIKAKELQTETLRRKVKLEDSFLTPTQRSLKVQNSIEIKDLKQKQDREHVEFMAKYNESKQKIKDKYKRSQVKEEQNVSNGILS